jgi:hypothetical protein
MASWKSKYVNLALACSTLAATAGSVAAVYVASAPSAEGEVRRLIEKIHHGVFELYEPAADYATVSPAVLINGRDLTELGERDFKTPWGSPIRVSPASLFAKNDAFLIEYESGSNARTMCAELKNVEAAFKRITWDERVLKSEDGGAKWRCDGVKPGAKVMLIGSKWLSPQ